MFKHLHGRGEDLIRAIGTHHCARNTSTDVEKTPSLIPKQGKNKKHLHGRGEDDALYVTANRSGETPPRTWRRLLDGVKDQARLGNTSTDVEKTVPKEPNF